METTELLKLKEQLDQDDREITAVDSQCLDELVRDILSNKRLAWKVVKAWLRANGYVLINRAS
jgi:hypothetical protein